MWTQTSRDWIPKKYKDPNAVLQKKESQDIQTPTTTTGTQEQPLLFRMRQRQTNTNILVEVESFPRETWNVARVAGLLTSLLTHNSTVKRKHVCETLAANDIMKRAIGTRIAPEFFWNVFSSIDINACDAFTNSKYRREEERKTGRGRGGALTLQPSLL